MPQPEPIERPDSPPVSFSRTMLPLVDQTNAQRLTGDGKYIAVEQTAQGTRIVWIGPPITNGLHQQFKITGISGDYLTCTYWDNANDGAQVLVAKTYLNRQTPFDGETRDGISYVYTDEQTRTATNDSAESITEIMTPAYVVGDQITGKYVANGTGVADSDGNAIVWMEDSDARTWCKDPNA